MESHTKRKSRLNSFEDGDCVLLVGEGDFSFAAFLIQCTKAYIVATTLLLPPLILSQRQKDNISLIKKFGGSVYTDVDATQLASHVYVSAKQYAAIIFNFPHIPGKMKISANRDLLRRFFISAREVLSSEGEIHVTLCKGQGGTAADASLREWQNTWQITAMAAISDFILDDVEAFHAEDYSTYRCSGYRGLEKSFHVDGALTHVFKLGHPVKTLETVFSSQTYNTVDQQHSLVSAYIDLCKKDKSLFEACEHPVAKAFSSVVSEIRNFFSVSSQEIISFPELLICPGKVCHKFQVKNGISEVKGLPCSANYLLSSASHTFQEVQEHLDRGTDMVIFSSSVCCPQNLLFAELPVSSNTLFLVRNHKVIYELCIVLNRVLRNQETTEIISDCCQHTSGLHQHTDNYQDLVTGNQFLNSFSDCLESLASFSCKECTFEVIGTVIVSFNQIHSGNCVLRQNVCISILDKNIDYLKEKDTQEDILKIGNVYAVTYKQDVMLCMSVDIEYVSVIKFHIFNTQILRSDLAYFSAHVYDDKLYEIYRSPSLFPPIYVHDISFWVSEEFEENKLILLVKNLVADIIRDIRLIDTYEKSPEKSHCYRFIYQSYDRPLSKEKVWDIHTNLVRDCIEQYLKVRLR